MRATPSRLRFVALLLLAFALLGLGQTVVRADDDDDDDGGSRVVLSANLLGRNEFPGPGDPDGRGTAKITIDLDTSTLCYRLKVRKIDPATMAHIHRGPAGVAGPVVVNFTPPSSGSSTGCLVVNPALAQEIAANPAGFYVNIHNTPYPAGALRGQLRQAGDD